jgi:hypothetical protein
MMTQTPAQADTYFGLCGFLAPKLSPGQTPEAIARLALPYAREETGLVRPTRLYTDPSGAWLRIGYSGEGAPESCQPFFPGTERMMARLRGFSPRPDDTYMDAHGYFEVMRGEEALYPLVATLAEPHRIARWAQDQLGQLSLTMLPHRFELFADEAAFAAHQQATADGRAHLAARAFIATGPAGPGGGVSEPSAAMTGIVRTAEERAVELTGYAVAVLGVATYGGAVTLVANRGAFGTLPAPGSLVRAQGWMSAVFEPLAP